MRVAVILFVVALAANASAFILQCPKNSEVLLPHNECSKYYQCVHGELVERRCSKGTYFNELTSTCDHADQVQCNNRLPEVQAPEDDDKEVQAPDFEHVPDVDDEQVENPEVEQAPENDEEENVPEPEQSPEDEKEEEEQTSKEGNENKVEYSCPKTIFVKAYFIPHESSCDKFYYCFAGKKYPRECLLHGWHFRYETQNCVPAVMAKCSL